ncbi:flavin-containing amine oxidoreductase [Pseudomassariella vexata]|uniref:Flavin-containing amine oxidoreductase n=1 Tax=Pseudomassariella vexata TaxID=1141098 RepID=A0A1Y2E0B5_9PEZI|nr:flavin-containing amine oxidoreductase [Pseudomassariella vexata]ORY64978.1 flavin-containing amine oxidoreductase [Pseudomassariella vexata]
MPRNFLFVTSTTYSCTSHRSTSRIWQDLKSCRLHHSVVELNSDSMSGHLSLAPRKCRSRDFSHRPHVAIVGAGLAGLRCADVLLQRGFIVTLLEARNRLGGRVHQEKLPCGHLIDVGPNWIHGTNDNPILDLAKQTDTVVGTWDDKADVFDQSGRLLDVPEAETHSTIMWNVVQDAFRHSNKNCATISPDESLWDFFQREVPGRIPSTQPDFEKKREVVFQMAEMWGAFVGSPIRNQSLKFFWLEECIEGENLFCAGTYQKILQLIAKPAVDSANIKYSTKVNKVKATADDNKLTVLTDSGETLEFDEVVMTAPLGWLKRHPEAFSPPLTTRLTKAINSISYGCLEKVYISFPRAFWTVPDARDRTIQGFCQWIAPKYAPQSNPKGWHQEIVELASLHPSVSHPTLLFYIYGDQSRYLTDEVAKLLTKEKKDAFLYDWFRPYYSRLPNYDEFSSDCQPTGCFSTDWLHDELAGNGSYGNFQVGLEEGDKDIETMREGLPDRGLWMAGEHTAPFVALGTATGAYWSGELVARRIADAYGRDKSGAPVAH